MILLHTLKRLRSMIAAWVLLAMAVVMAAPLVQPLSLELICSGSGGYFLLAHASDSSPGPGSPDMDCGLCLMSAAPPPPPFGALPVLQATHTQLALPDLGYIPDTIAALPPARAPPRFLSHT
jgi:hypothetical protein